MAQKRQSAFLRATQEAQKPATPQESKAVAQEESITVAPQQSETVAPQDRTTAKKQEKITFYLTTEQTGKLDDLAYEYRKARGKRINRNDIVRYLIDQCNIESIGEI